jgi:peptidoglycan/LPS O-acetylase OafA/YrhL
MSNKFAGLDLLRFVMAVYLMVFHTFRDYPKAAGLPFVELLQLGGFATSTFFLLSGFILAHVYFGRQDHVAIGRYSARIDGGTRAFLVKRLTNLYPIHILSLTLYVALSLLGTRALNVLDVNTLFASHPSATLDSTAMSINVALQLLLLQTWNPLYVPLNPPSWSLSVLFFFYLAFPVAAPRLLNARYKTVTLLSLWLLYLLPPTIAASMQWTSPAVVGIVMFNPLLRLPEFLCGIVLYGMFREAPHTLRFNLFTRSAAIAFSAACFVTGALLVAHAPPYWQYPLHNGALMPAEMALILVCAAAFKHASPFVTRWCARLGNSALSLFAIHLPVFMVFIKIDRLRHIEMPWTTCFTHPSACAAPIKNVPLDLSAYPFYLLLSIVLAVLFQQYLVGPARDWLRRGLIGPRHDRASEAASPGSAMTAP